MHFQYIPYVWFLLTAAAVTAALGIYAWRQRIVPGATPFAGLMLLAVVWALTNALEMAGTDLPTKLFWANVQYLCYVALPVAWLALALQYTGRDEWLTRRNLALLMIEPLITVVLVWTNPLHGLMRQNVHLDTAGPFPVIDKTFGPWFWVHAAYTYLLLSLTIYLFLTALRASPLSRRQTRILLIGTLLPMAWNALYNFSLSPIPRHDVAPTRLIKAEMPEAKIVMLTVSEEDEDLFEAIKSGASGYLLKSLDADQFFELLSELERGEAPLSPGLAARILEEFARQPRADPETFGRVQELTRRQMTVLTLVAQGMTYKEVGEALCLSERTVKYHMGEILERLHLESRAQVIAYAARMGLVRRETQNVKRQA